MSELAHTLNIVQEKLKTLQKRRIDHVQKIATKRFLLKQSYSVLQQDLKMALAQDKKSLHSISNHNEQDTTQLVSLIPSTTEQQLPVPSSSTTKDTTKDNTTQKPQQLFELVECQGWIRAGQVMIRAYGVPLQNCQDITQAHLWISNNDTLSSEDIRLNTRYHLSPGTKYAFYISFPTSLDPDEDDEDGNDHHSISCVYKVKNEYFTSDPIPIRYSNNAQDTSWLLDSVLQVYFTCHVRIKQVLELDHHAFKKWKLRMVSKESEKEMEDDNSMFISKDQSILVHRVNEEMFDIYGFETTKVASIVSKLNYDFEIVSHDTLKNLILSFGDELLTFGSVDYPNARAKMLCFMAAQ